MSNHKKSKPVFHEASPNAPKPEFRPHHVGAEEEYRGTGVELPLPEKPFFEAIDDLDAILENTNISETTPHPTGASQGQSDTLNRQGTPEDAQVRNAYKNGWQEITEDQQDGKTYWVTADLESDGIQAFWRKTRVLSHYRWVMHGKWSIALTRQDVLPQPIYYKGI